jgi:hypothetical protein
VLKLVSEVEVQEELLLAVREGLMGVAEKELALMGVLEVKEMKFLGVMEIWEEK